MDCCDINKMVGNGEHSNACRIKQIAALKAELETMKGVRCANQRLRDKVEGLEVVVDGLQIERDDYCNLYHSALKRVRRAKIEALEEVLGDERFPDAVAVNATIMLAKLKAEGDNQQTTTKGS